METQIELVLIININTLQWITHDLHHHSCGISVNIYCRTEKCSSSRFINIFLLRLSGVHRTLNTSRSAHFS